MLLVAAVKITRVYGILSVRKGSKNGFHETDEPEQVCTTILDKVKKVFTTSGEVRCKLVNFHSIVHLLLMYIFIQSNVVLD